MAGQGEWWDGLLPDREGGGSLSGAEDTPIVKWVPIRCPYCGSRKKRYRGGSRHKPVRYHRCLNPKCGRLYRSIEED